MKTFREYFNDEHEGYMSEQQWKNYRLAALHLLAVAEEWRRNDKETGFDSADDLLEHLRQYIHGKQEA